VIVPWSGEDAEPAAVHTDVQLAVGVVWAEFTAPTVKSGVIATVTDPLVTETGETLRDLAGPESVERVYPVPFQYETYPDSVAAGTGVAWGSVPPLIDDTEADAEYPRTETRSVVVVHPEGAATDAGSPPSETVPSDILAVDVTHPLVSSLEQGALPPISRSSNAVSAALATVARLITPKLAPAYRSAVKLSGLVWVTESLPHGIDVSCAVPLGLSQAWAVFADTVDTLVPVSPLEGVAVSLLFADPVTMIGADVELEIDPSELES